MTTSTSAGLQTISGYTPPVSTALAAPSVASGTILTPEAIPGYNETVNSGAMMDFFFQPAIAAAGGAAVGVAYVLF